MLKKAVLLLSVLLIALTAQEKGRTLKVKINYTGSGTVDDKHPVRLFLFDSPDFVHGGGMPFAMKSTTSKDGTITFTDVTASPVYASSVFDATGGYDGESGPPPSGASMGLYMTTPGEPGAIKLEAGKTVEVELPFDDTIKMP